MKLTLTKDGIDKLFKACASFIISIFVSSSHATPDVIGTWKTFDSKQNERSHVQFYMVGNELRADIVKLLSGIKATTCVNCSGDKKNVPLIGLTIISNLKLKDKKWVDGKVFDIDSGKYYQCELSLSEDGNTMLFHPYLRLPTFGRTLKWYKVKS